MEGNKLFHYRVLATSQVMDGKHLMFFLKVANQNACLEEVTNYDKSSLSSQDEKSLSWANQENHNS